LKESGSLTGFRFNGIDFPVEPKTVFYDWLYCSFLLGYRDWAPNLYAYAGFQTLSLTRIDRSTAKLDPRRCL